MTKEAFAKRNQLEREIADSHATDDEKANMQHTLSKLLMFLADECDEWKKRAYNQFDHPLLSK